MNITTSGNSLYPVLTGKLARKGGNGKFFESRKVGNNTYLTWVDAIGYGRDLAIKLHATNILTVHADSSVTLDTGGWLTVTTKARLNEWLPAGWRVSSDRGVWYLYNYQTKAEFVFQDGITIQADGTVTGAGPRPNLAEKKRAANYAARFAKALVAGHVPAPGPGDCLFCQGRFTDLATGQPATDSDHIKSHIAGGYFVPALLVNAVTAFPVSPAARTVIAARWYPDLAKGRDVRGYVDAFGDIVTRQITRSIKRYLYRQLGFAS